MALIKCPECGKEISDLATQCPHCGCPSIKWTEIKKREEQIKEEPIEERTISNSEINKNTKIPHVDNNEGVKVFMFVVGLIVAIIAIMLYFSRNSETTPPDSTTNNHVTELQSPEGIILTDADKKAIDQFIALYNELKGFKSKSDFIANGFIQGGKYYNWLQKVHNLNTDANTQSLIKLRVVPNDLECLAMEYVSSKGKENELTQLFIGSVESAICQYNELTQAMNAPASTTPSKQVDGSSNEESLGKWKLTVPGVSGQIIVEIFKKGNSYYMVENGKHKKLRCEGDRYYVVGNEWSEYYRIVNGNLKMGDRQGDLPADSGWKITKLK